jgi:hypothetical protein
MKKEGRGKGEEMGVSEREGSLRVGEKKKTFKSEFQLTCDRVSFARQRASIST